MTSGYQAGGTSAPLVQRLQAVYEGTSEITTMVAVLQAIPLIKGSGRNQAIPWLREKILRGPEELKFPYEAEEAVVAAAKLGQAGREMVRGLLLET